MGLKNQTKIMEITIIIIVILGLIALGLEFYSFLTDEVIMKQPATQRISDWCLLSIIYLVAFYYASKYVSETVVGLINS